MVSNGEMGFLPALAHNAQAMATPKRVDDWKQRFVRMRLFSAPIFVGEN